MTKLLLDTNVLINLVRGNKVADAIKSYIGEKDNPQFFISVVTIAEVKS
ncbi:MAG: hypothetical protein JJU02_02430 [Cryomorphaceae bacterium]|nr:hypothetical protein [Cryomorphaceae bacterium]